MSFDDLLHAPPPDDPLDLLQLAVQAMVARVQAHVARHHYRLLSSAGTLDNAYVSFDEARALLSGTPPRHPTPWPTLDAAMHAIYEADEALARALRQAGQIDPLPPLLQLMRRFALPDELLLPLLAAVAPQLSVDVDRLYRFAQADFVTRRPTIGFLAELITEHLIPHPAELARFADHSPLVRSRLLRIEHTDAAATTPLLQRLVTVPDAVIAFLTDQLGPPGAELEAFCALDASAPLTSEQVELHPDAARDLQRALQDTLFKHADSFATVALCGPRGAGRRTALRSILHGLGAELLSVNLQALAAESRRAEALLDAILLYARLKGAHLLLRADVLADETPRALILPLLARLLPRASVPVLLTAPHPRNLAGGTWGPLHVVNFPPLPRDRQRVVWRRAAEHSARPLDDNQARLLTERFDLTPGAITLAASRAALNRRRDITTEQATISAIYGELGDRIGDLARPFRTGLGWDDVVLPDDLLRTFQDVLARARFQTQVYERWGFGKKVPYGRGLSCLFSGPPGTGKTMMASVLAAELGLELYRVDISRVVSKWIGETEKNLGRLFDEAESAQIILFFDEADSLFSQRTEVKGSNDRFANMEINFLLQRMESYTGVSVLTTNLTEGIDEAFMRRISFKLFFPMPDIPLRERLWRSMLPPQALFEDDIDFLTLAETFEMSGGHIKNAVLRAAFRAASRDEPITHDHLYDAALDEFRELGKLIRYGM